jgi:hypothetical protein
VTATQIRFHAAGGAKAQAFVPVVYAATAAGTPTNLVVQGAAVTVAAGQGAGWVSVALPATTLPAGRYLLGLLSGPSGGSARVTYAPVSNAGVYHAHAYPTPLAAWGATVQREARSWTVALA